MQATIKAIVSLMLLSLGATAFASNYPPNYAWERQCHETAELRICQSDGTGSRNGLTVQYKGYLRDASRLSIYVKLNGQEGLYAMTNRQDGSGFRVSLTDGAKDCWWNRDANYWNCNYAEAVEKQLFLWARNQYGAFNAWDVEVAFVDDWNSWDSRYGENYKFRFKDRAY